MKSIKMLGLAALAALMAMAFVGASSAMAGNTQLCTADENPCGTGHAVTHIHEVTSENALLLNSLGNVKCEVLFLSTSVGALAAPQIIHGNFTYSNCKRKKLIGEENCTVTEINGPVEIKVLRTAAEEAEVVGEGEVEVHCGSIIECVYNGEGLNGAGKGQLLGSTGTTSLSEQVTHKVGGGFCPETAKLDITTHPLANTFISS